ncbi:MAG: glycosyl hydrolase 53 family protein [Oscillospiraceae bacterium]|nr:glycosyl hydrolase 53 family protein [Oscillospiraceae bacterium]
MKFKNISAAVLAVMMGAQFITSPVSAEDTGKITGLAEGYYDVTAEYSNSSVDGSCYMWARSNASTKGTAVLPKSTETSGTTVTIKGIYVNDGTIEYGLYNDGTSIAQISNVKAEVSKESIFLNGGDISEYTIVHDMGGKYYDFDDNEINPIEYLGANGMNACRIRLSNDPGPGHGDGTYYLPAGYQNEEDCLALAREAKDAGMQIVFTFNYSDYWSNGERQRIPSDWVLEIKNSLGYDIEDYTFLSTMTMEQKTEIKNKLSELIYNYTERIMKELAEQGTTPEYVSIGNEINGGVFLPFGGSYDSFYNPAAYSIEYEQTADNITYKTDFEGIAQFLNSGYDAIKAVSPDTQVIVHLASDGGFSYSNAGNHRWWFDAYQEAGGKWDVTGISYYPSWTTQTASVCKSRVNELSEIYNKPVIIMEAGYNWTDKKKDGYDGQLFNIDAYRDIYPDTESGHKGFMAELINYMRQADNCIGVLYWDPLKIHVEDERGNNLVGWAITEEGNNTQVNVVENTTLFNFDGKAISTVQLYSDTRNPRRKENTVAIVSAAIGSAEIAYDCDENTKTDIYIAAYDKEGILIDVKKSAVTGKGTCNVRFNDSAASVKAFMWISGEIAGFTVSNSESIE